VEKVRVALQDGKAIEVKPGLKVRELASSLGVDGEVVAAKLDGKPVDLERAIKGDCSLDWIRLDSPEGIDILRHSTAHLMAQAVQALFPGTQVTIGPVIENGFYYDFKREKPFAPEELEQIENKMRELAKRDEKVERQEMRRDEAVEMFRRMGEDYKVEIIQGIPEEAVSLYRQGDWVDLCRGPHVPSTGKIRAFKLTSVAGAYWRGDEKNEMLQRIYGTSWPTKEALDEHLKLLEQAKSRDHRRLGRELDLFSFHPIAPASPFFHPKGAAVYNELVNYMRRLYGRYGYQEVITPQIFDVELWRRSDRGPRVRRQADELSGPYVHLRREETLLPGPAAPLRRFRPAAPLREVRRHRGPHPRALVLSGRRAHLLRARSNRERDDRSVENAPRGLPDFPIHRHAG
jgi:threonyl-tRNA synthetase